MSIRIKKMFRLVVWLLTVAYILASALFFIRQNGRIEQNAAKAALAKTILAVATGTKCEDVEIETSLYDNPSEFSPDFPANYKIIGTDYFFGTWDFYVEFPDTGRDYYFGISYDDTDAKWHVRIRPPSACSGVQSTVCELGEYVKEKWDPKTVPGAHLASSVSEGILTTRRYSLKPGISVDRNEICSRPSRTALSKTAGFQTLWRRATIF